MPARQTLPGKRAAQVANGAGSWPAFIADERGVSIPWSRTPTAPWIRGLSLLAHWTGGVRTPARQSPSLALLPRFFRLATFALAVQSPDPPRDGHWRIAEFPLQTG